MFVESEELGNQARFKISLNGVVMLEPKQFEGMQHLFKQYGQTFCFSLEEARQFCWRMKLTDNTASIVYDPKADKYYIENDPCPFVRVWEQRYFINDAKAA